MKKTYIHPEASFELVWTQQIIAASVNGFNQQLDDENPITTGDMLGRQNGNIWDDDYESGNDPW